MLPFRHDSDIFWQWTTFFFFLSNCTGVACIASMGPFFYRGRGWCRGPTGICRMCGFHSQITKNGTTGAISFGLSNSNQPRAFSEATDQQTSLRIPLRSPAKDMKHWLPWALENITVCNTLNRSISYLIRDQSPRLSDFAICLKSKNRGIPSYFNTTLPIGLMVWCSVQMQLSQKVRIYFWISTE